MDDVEQTVRAADREQGESAAPRLGPLVLVALGVVFGDIGTSPLYAVRECFHGPHAIPLTPAHVLGVLSLVFWSLAIVISVKYLLFVLRADNEGEGGILALMALARGPGRGPRLPAWTRTVMVVTGLFGASLLYGDGMITPAISVLSAVEGLGVATPVFQPFVVPLTVLILLGLFLVQHRGTSQIGRLFGPVTLAWFLAIGALGIAWILREPGILLALSPHHAVAFFLEARLHAFLVLGAVFLVVTGGEALYADMGHVGARPIRIAWFALVLPSLLLNYFGQGALLLARPELAASPFYHMAPQWALYPLVGLATAATIIASQAVITGSFSLTWQAIQLGYLPRFEVQHTTEEQFGQIYIPTMNWLLMLATLGLVLGFRSSGALAAAYGVAVTTTMVITTLLIAVVMRRLWRWPRGVVLAVTALFLGIDLAFFGANIVKVPQGGWFPLLVGLGGLIVMATWRTGRRILRERLVESGMTYADFRRVVAEHAPRRVPGTAVFLTSSTSGVPPAMLWLLEHAKVLHERILLLNVSTTDEPHVRASSRLDVQRVEPGLFRLEARYGFMQHPDVPRLLLACRREAGLEDLDPRVATYVLGRETLLATERPGMAIWRERLFALLSRNAGRATAYFGIPPDRVLEVGAQIQL